MITLFFSSFGKIISHVTRSCRIKGHTQISKKGSV